MIYPGLAEQSFKEYELNGNKDAMIKDVATIMTDSGYLKAAEIFLRMMLPNGNKTETKGE